MLLGWALTACVGCFAFNIFDVCSWWNKRMHYVVSMDPFHSSSATTICPHCLDFYHVNIYIDLVYTYSLCSKYCAPAPVLRWSLQWQCACVSNWLCKWLVSISWHEIKGPTGLIVTLWSIAVQFAAFWVACSGLSDFSVAFSLNIM